MPITPRLYPESQADVYFSRARACNLQAVSTPIQRALELATKRGLKTQTAFGLALGLTAQHVTNWKKRGLPPERLEQVAALLNCSTDYLLGRSKTIQPGLEAHPVTLDALTVQPTIRWSELSMNTLPEVFRTIVPDAALAPRLLPGTTVVLTRDLPPRPGDGVLVRDAEGHHYLRVYREGRVGRWEAHAFNEAFRPLDSLSDQLTVVAVVTATDGRWSV